MITEPRHIMKRALLTAAALLATWYAILALISRGLLTL